MHPSLKIGTEVDQVDPETECLTAFAGTMALVLYYNYFFIILRNKPKQQAKHPEAVNGPQNSNRAGGEFD